MPALLDLVRVLAERDEVTVFALRYPHRRRPYSVHGARVWPTGGAQRAGWARPPILLRTLARIRREDRERPFDVLHALWAHEPGFVAVTAGRLLRRPTVVSILGGELADLPEIDYGGERSRINRWLVARALAGADRVTVGSRWLAEQVACRVPSSRLARHPLGVDLERFRPVPEESESPRLSGGPRLLQVASLVPVKDQRLLLATTAQLVSKHSGLRLHLVGDGELDAALRRQAAELGMTEQVVFHGSVDHGRLAGYYRQADLYVQSSRFESQGLAVLEAVACGCPVVGTAVGTLPELGADAVSAAGDVGALAGLIDGVLADPERRARLRDAQSEAVRGFELRASVAAWRRRYREAQSAGEPDGTREATD